MNYQLKQHYAPGDSLCQYGDGVFETMLAVADDIYHWRYHWARLQRSCERLGIGVPDRDALYNDLQQALIAAGHKFAVVKMIVSRGEGLRGYRTQPSQPCFVQFSVAPYVFNPDNYSGLSVRVCQTRLAHQPLLAGMKHCNRLEYLMARREAEDAKFDEGLLLDYDSRLIEGLITNLFIMKGQQLTTPPLDNAGVAGTLRAYLLDSLPENGYSIAVSPLTLDDMARADAVFLSNATNGVMPVRRVQGIDKDFAIESVHPIRQMTEHPSL